MELLDAHEASRRAGLPIVSVGRGPSGDVLATLRDWAARRGGAILLWRGEERDELGARVLAAVLSRGSVESRARDLLRSAGLEPDDVSGRDVSGPEEHFLQDRLDGVSRLALGILRGRPERPPWIRLSSFLAHLGSLCAEDDRPLLLGIAGDHDAPNLAKAVCELAIETRGWPIALCVAESAWPAIEASLSDRELALLRQGLFHVEAPHVVMPPEFGPAGLGVTETLHARVRNLRELGVAAARLAALATWASRGAMPSAPEQFLAEVLDDRVETTGLFELHGKLPVQFGTKPMEVDLLCRRPRIAIELDGWFHFTDRDHYRRDRRKDILLHEHGYVVLRFLAEDVVSHLEEVLSVITRSLTRARGQA